MRPRRLVGIHIADRNNICTGLLSPYMKVILKRGHDGVSTVRPRYFGEQGDASPRRLHLHPWAMTLGRALGLGRSARAGVNG